MDVRVRFDRRVTVGVAVGVGIVVAVGVGVVVGVAVGVVMVGVAVGVVVVVAVAVVVVVAVAVVVGVVMIAALLSVDASLVSPGVAWWEQGVLVRAQALRQPSDLIGGDIGDRASIAAKHVWCWALASGVMPSQIMVEVPQVYTRSKSAGDPNDLIACALVAGGVAALAKWSGAIVQSTLPAGWIGRLPKSRKGSAWASPRGKRIRSRLSPLELSRCEDSHDAVDAVGLGLFALSRLEPRRVFHR